MDNCEEVEQDITCEENNQLMNHKIEPEYTNYGEKDFTSVRVAVRVRPLIGREKVDRCEECIQVLESDGQVIIGKDRSFTYDYVFGKYSQQCDVWQCVSPLIESHFEGYNATIFAYGQTGSGKTYTMGSGNNVHILEEEQGILPRVIFYTFDKIRSQKEANPGYDANIKVSFLEIYGEEIRDLLDPMGSSKDGNKVMIRETDNGQVQVTGAKEEEVDSTEECMRLLEKGSICRTTGSTLMNAHSSRSHAVFTISTVQHIRSTSTDPSVENADDIKEEVETRSSYFNFIDLAGSERQKRTQAEGKRLKEGIDINKGLLALGNVISALGDERKRGKVHIPYRDSKLTRMLQDSLGGNSKTLMITCVSPADVNFEETLNALKYANRARNIKNKAVVNRDPSSAIVGELRRQVQILQLQLAQARGDDSVGPFPSVDFSTNIYSAELDLFRGRAEVAENEVLRMTAEIKRLKNTIEDMSNASISAQAERDYYKIRCEESSDNNIQPNDNLEKEKEEKIGVLNEHLRTISDLKCRLAKAESERDTAKLMVDDSSLPSFADDSLSDALEAKLENGIQKDIETRDGETVVHAANEAEEFEMQRVFQQRQKHLGATVTDLSNNISVKEQLLHNLQKSQQNYDRMKDFYDQKMQQMNEELRVSQKDRDRLLHEIQSIESKTGSEKDNRQKLVKELKEKDSQISLLRKKQKDLEKYSHVQKKNEQQMRQLYTDISNMKKQKVDLIKKMQTERKKYEEEASNRRREILSLKRVVQKDQQQIRKMGSQKEAQDRVMRRKIEEMSVVNKRLRQQQVGKHLTIEEKRKKVWLSEEVKKLAEKQKKADAIQAELEKREHIIHKMEGLYGMRAKLQEDFKKILPEGQINPSATIRDVLISPSKQANSKTSSLSVEEEETLHELEERIEACQAQLEYRDDKISEMQQYVDDPSDTMITMEKIESLPEARTLLKMLFEMAVSAKQTEQKKHDEASETRARIEILENELHESNSSLQNIKMVYDSRVTEIQKQHEEKLTFYMDYYNSKEKDKSLATPLKLRRTSSFGGSDTPNIKLLLDLSSVEDNLDPQNDNSIIIDPPLSPPKSRTKIMLSMAEERNNVLKKQIEDLQYERDQLKKKNERLESKMKTEHTSFKSSNEHYKISEAKLHDKSKDSSIRMPSPTLSTNEQIEPTNLSEISMVIEPPSDEISGSGEDNQNDEIVSNSIFQRLSNPTNFTGIHKHRMQDNIKKNSTLRDREDKMRNRRLRDRKIELTGDLRNDSKNFQQKNSNRPRTASLEKHTQHNAEYYQQRLNMKVSEIIENMDNFSIRDTSNKSIEKPENQHEKSPLLTDKKDVYCRLAEQFTASAQQKRQPQRLSRGGESDKSDDGPSSTSPVREENHAENEELPNIEIYPKQYHPVDPLLGDNGLVEKVYDDYKERLHPKHFSLSEEKENQQIEDIMI